MSRMHGKYKDAHNHAEPFWNIGLYIRLSREDESQDESESIINQEKILRDFVDNYFDPGTFMIADVFADDTAILGLKSEL